MATDQSTVKTKDSDWQDYTPAKPSGDSDWQDYTPATPAAKTIEPPNATAQARQTITNIGSQMEPSFWGGAYPSSKEEKYIDERIPLVAPFVKDVRKNALMAGGAAFGGELGNLAKGLPGFLRYVAGTSGAGAGAGLGTLAGGGSGKEALANAGFTSLVAAPSVALAEAAPSLRAGFARAVRDPISGRVRTPWEIAMDKVAPDVYAPKTVPAKPIPRGTNYGQFLENQRLAAKIPPPEAPTDPVAEAVKGRRAAWLPTRMPRIAPPQEIVRSPFQEMVSSARPGGAELQLPPASELQGRPTLFPEVRSKIAGPTGAAEKPFEPIVYESPEEASARDFRMKNLERQAKSAGTYHASQGASGKRLNLQQRIEKRLGVGE